MSEEAGTPNKGQPVNPTPQPQPTPQQPYMGYQPEQKANTALGIVGIIVSVLGCLICIVPCGVDIFIGGPLALIGLVMGAIYLYQASKYKSNSAMGIIALTIGIIGMLIIPGKYWWFFESVEDANTSSWNINSGNNTSSQQSPYSYQADSTDVDEELEEVEDIIEDIEEDFE